MADEFDGHAALPVDRLLERENHENTTRDRAHASHAPRPRRPQLRADVVRHRDAPYLHRAREPIVESPEIDWDEHSRRRCVGRRDQPTLDGEQLRQPGERFGEAAGGDFLTVRDRAAAGAGEFPPAEAKHVDFRDERTHLPNECASVEIAGCLAAREKDAQRQDAERLNSDGSSGRLSWMSSTRRFTVIGPTWRSARKGICTPSTAR